MVLFLVFFMFLWTKSKCLNLRNSFPAKLNMNPIENKLFVSDGEDANKNLQVKATVSRVTESIVTDNSDDLRSLCELAHSSHLETIYPGGWSCSNYHLLNLTTACNWNGITCDENMIVVSLDLSFSPVIGTIPASIGNLKHLTLLNLKYTLFHGVIPTTIGLLTALQQLLLSSSKFSGVIPTSIGYLTALQIAAIGFNQFIGSIPTSIGYLTALQELELGMCKLSGVIPTQIGMLTALQILSLSYNMISGVIPAQIGSLQALQTLILGSNELLGTIPSEVGYLTALRSLILRDNKLNGAIPRLIWELSSLKGLRINGNKLSSSIPSAIANLRYLEQLRIQSNSLTSSLPSIVGVLTNLQGLNFGYNEMTGVLPSSIGFLTKLTLLAEHNGLISGTLPSSIGNLVNLQQVWLSNNMLSGPIPTSIGGLKSLYFLYLGNNKLTSSIPSTIGDLSEIVDLELSTNSLTGVIPESIGNLTKLTFLTLKRNSLQSSIPANIGDLKNSLQMLWLSYNKLTGVIPTSIGNLSSLQFLYLHGNSLKSSIPTSIGNLLLLESMQIQNNRLSGCIPTSLGNLVNLGTLDIGNNLLGGNIPTNIGLLTMLQTLGMGHNSLQGSIPSSIGMISSLTSLDLSYNQLNSSIPKTLSDMKALGFLTLNNNQLSLTVPSQLAYLSQLKALALDHNRLSGVFPLELCRLPNLRHISLSQNNMSCAPWCQADYSSSDLARCQDYQDNVFYDLQNNLQVSPALKIKASLNRSSSTIQSSHPFQFNKVDSFFYIFPNIPIIEVENAIEYQLIMSQFQMYGWLYICKDSNCNKFYGRYGSLTGYDKETEVGWQYYDYSRPCILDKKDNNNCFKTTSTNKTGPFIIKDSSFYIQYKHNWNFCPKINNFYQCGPSFGFIIEMTSIPNIPVGWDFKPSPPYPTLTNASVYASALCTWQGVMCDKGNVGLVTSLNLAGLGLMGTLPTSIGLLTALTSIDLSGNLISGSIVSSFGQLSTLRILNLNQNKFERKLPEDLGNATQLFAVSVSNNKLTGPIPTILDAVTSLQYLFLDGNSFSNEVPMELCKAFPRRNVTVSLMNNPFLSCYQDGCWNRVDSTLMLDSKLTLCIPTSVPTVTPTKSPTANPTPQPVSTTEIIKPLVSTSQLIAIVVIIPTFAVLFLAYMVYRKCFSEKALLRQAKERRLKVLPIHRALSALKDLNDGELPSIIDTHIHTANEKDIDGKTALELILHDRKNIPEDRLSDKVVHRLLVECLPIDVVSFEEINETDRFRGWTEAVQSDYEAVVVAVDRVLCDYKQHIKILANAKDSVGRKCVDIASKRCKDSIYRHLFLHGTYDVQEGPPVHKSATSLVVYAIAHMRGKKNNALAPKGGESQGENSVRPVALKFMRNRDQFEREVEVRRRANFDEKHVISVLSVFGDDTEEDMKFREDAVLKGYGDYPFCIVMEAASQNLKHVIDHEYIVNSDWKTIRDMALNLTKALQHMHEKGVIHGDLKPLNILRVGMTLKLTDLDASVSYGNGEMAGSKYSSGYLCPEMLWMDANDDDIRVRSARNVQEGVSISLQDSSISMDEGSPIWADPSQDIWALGCVLYYLCTGASLFHVNTEDNIISQQEFVSLFDWDLYTMNEKLSVVTDSLARNLLSLLLSKDPNQRPSAARVLHHPFLTGKSTVRLPGEEATWDVFLSYRVASDSAHVEMIYHALTALGLKVWWDKMCLLPGQNWEECFCNGLLTSRDFVCLSSRGAINNPDRDAQNWEKLTETSKCDNVLLEWRLALDLKERGMLTGIFPVRIGDKDAASGQYSRYTTSGCHPNPADVVVATVETKVREHLAREGLGMPYKESISVKAVLTEVFINQGGKIEGDLTSSVEQIALDVQKMSRLHKSRPAFSSRILHASTSSSRRQNSSNSLHRQYTRDNDSLKARTEELEKMLIDQEIKNSEFIVQQEAMFHLQLEDYETKLMERGAKLAKREAKLEEYEVKHVQQESCISELLALVATLQSQSRGLGASQAEVSGDIDRSVESEDEATVNVAEDAAGRESLAL